RLPKFVQQGDEQILPVEDVLTVAQRARPVLFNARVFQRHLQEAHQERALLIGQRQLRLGHGYLPQYSQGDPLCARMDTFTRDISRFLTLAHLPGPLVRQNAARRRNAAPVRAAPGPAMPAAWSGVEADQVAA